jgi:hypothetical protein
LIEIQLAHYWYRPVFRPFFFVLNAIDFSEGGGRIVRCGPPAILFNANVTGFRRVNDWLDVEKMFLG